MSNVTFRTRLTALCSVLLLVCTLIVGVNAGTASAGPPTELALRYFAGDGWSGSPTPGPALGSRIQTPQGIAIDPSGNAFITDFDFRVGKVTPDGTLSIFAGTGNPGTPTPGPATSSDMGVDYSPLTDIATDSAGNVYIVDNLRVLKVTAGGTLSILAGTGEYGLPTPGPATSSMLGGPRGLAVDSAGNVYISYDYQDWVGYSYVERSQVLKVTPGGTLSVFAGSGAVGPATPGPATSSTIVGPEGLAVDSADNVYIADAFGSQVLKVTPGGTLSIFAGTGDLGTPTPGPATDSDMDSPTGLAVDSSDNVYITDPMNTLVYKVTSGGILSIIAGNGVGDRPVEGPATSSPFMSPNGIAVDPNDDVYVVDTDGLRVVKLTTSVAAPSAPRDLRSTPLDRSAGIWFTDPETNGGSTITKYQYSIDDGSTWHDAGVSSPVTISGLINATTYSVKLRAVNSVGESAASSAVTVTPQPGYTQSFFAGTGSRGGPTPGPASSSALSQPRDVAVDSSGNVYVLDHGNLRVEKITPDGTLSTFAGTGAYGAPTAGPATNSKFTDLLGIAIDSSDNVYISDRYSMRVVKVTPGGTLSFFAGSGASGAPTPGPATSSNLNPRGLAVDSNGNVFISVDDVYRVVKVTPGGTLSFFAGNGTSGAPTPGPATSSRLRTPGNLAVDSSGNLYIADGGNQQILKVTPGGTLSIAAGTGTAGASTEGPATSSNLSSPIDVATDSSGNLFINDADNYRVLKVDSTGNLTIISGSGLGGDPTEGPALLSSQWYSFGIGSDPSGIVYVAMTNSHRVVKLTPPSSVVVPDAPSSLVAAPGDSSVSVAFTAGADGGAEISNYEYQLNGSGSWFAFSPAVTSSPVSIPVTNGVSYTVKLRAVNSAGSGAESDASASFTPATTPSVPTSVTVTAGVGSASIAFTAGADGGSAITKYQVKVGAGTWTDAVGTTSPITVTGLSTYSTVSVRLRAVNSVGAGAASTGVQVWPRIAGSSLTSVNVEGSSKVRASFAALTPVGGSTSHYWVYAYTKGTNTIAGSCRSTTVSRSCAVTGLSANTEYDVVVRGFFTLTGSPTVLPTFDSARQTVRTNS